MDNYVRKEGVREGGEPNLENVGAEGWGVEGWGAKDGGAEGWGAEGWGPKFRAFFSSFFKF